MDGDSLVKSAIAAMNSYFELNNENLSIETLFESIPVAVALLDREGRHLVINHALAAISGLKYSDLVGRKVSDLSKESGENIKRDFAFFDAGALIHGTDNAAGEIGHVTVIDEDSRGPLGPPRPCACGRSGCLETVLSQSALRCVAAGEWGDDVVGIMNAIGVQLGTVLAPVTATLNVADIIIAGPEGIDLSPLLQATEQTIRKRTLPRSHRNLRVHLSSIGVDGALRGAAVLVLSGQLGIS